FNHAIACLLLANERESTSRELIRSAFDSYAFALGHPEIPVHVGRLSDARIAADPDTVIRHWAVTMHSLVSGRLDRDAELRTEVGKLLQALPPRLKGLIAPAFSGNHAGVLERLVTNCTEVRKSKPKNALI